MKIKHTPIGNIFTYNIDTSKSEGVKVYNKLFGHLDKSYFGKYKYKREGLLSNLNYIKLRRSTILVRVKDSNLLRKFFRENKIKFNERIVFLSSNEARKLKIIKPSKWENILDDIKGSRDLLVTVDF